ncbi:MAG: hypothetical protein CME62_09140 [Halobacteriovoraceae bacterium]|nr:hypothetical protein [Halobacteriovoraceae bacterium]
MKNVINNLPDILSGKINSKVGFSQKFFDRNIFFIERGFIAVSSKTVASRKSVLILGKNDLFPLLDQTYKPLENLNYTALSDIEYMGIPIKKLLEYDTDLMDKLIYENLRSALLNSFKIQEIAHHNKTHDKLKVALSMLESKIGTDGDYLALPSRMNITRLSHLLGCSRESLSSCLKSEYWLKNFSRKNGRLLFKKIAFLK